MNIKEEIETTLLAIDKSIFFIKREAMILRVKPEELRDSSGKFFMHDLLVAKANLLVAAIHIKERESVPIIQTRT